MSFGKCVKLLKDGKVIENRSQISIKEYYSIKDLVTPGKIVIKKDRWSFMHAGNNFIVDTCEVDGLVFSVLIIQGHKDRKTVVIPEIIEKNIISEISCEINRSKC